ncbi:hypothetical protein BLNAU_6797 [Blattamonas nauphoetae]|uniref:Uncharacterized protein n=1 Tax=Blattamonas nauphoetae TaxID=2049346 RepID=A0ABQ9Y3L9_9EUKA|nr:hypothetical protein BLNAU_6797 [Blattamonas nauphoetae]
MTTRKFGGDKAPKSIKPSPPPKIEPVSPFTVSSPSESDADLEWVKSMEQKIEALQTRMSAVLQKQSHQLWEQYCARTSENNSIIVNSLADQINEIAEVEHLLRRTQNEIEQTQESTSSLAQKLVAEG